MKAIIEVDIPEYQIGQEVNIYFKDTMMIKGITEKIESFAKLPFATSQEKTEQFAEWVAREIFDDEWEYNKNSFAEIACRKLAKIGIVREKDDEWELVERSSEE